MARRKVAEPTVAELVAMSPSERAARLKRKSNDWAERFEANWANWVREDQRVPPGDWYIWLLLAGRGFGKTRVGAEWVRAAALGKPGARIALVAETPAEARAVMVEGVSGVMNIGLAGERPDFESSLKRLVWPNGSMAMLYGASDADSLRGPEHDFAWCDEVGKWPDAVAAWDNLMLTLRRGRRPQAVATTTPRGGPLLRRLITEKGVVVTRGRTRANQLNVDNEWVAAMARLYGGTRLGRQELDGELLEDSEGALWTRDLIERCRVAAPPELRRVVVGVDPPAGTGSGAGGDACGIIVVGKGMDGKAYVLADHSVAARSPAEWARAVAVAAQAWQADRVVAEVNQGGDMVVSTLLAADVAMPVKKVHAARGKVARAEPVLTLYEAGKALHAGAFPDVEDELCGLITGGGYQGPGRSPDRADALVWAMSELMLQGGSAEPRLRQP